MVEMLDKLKLQKLVTEYPKSDDMALPFRQGQI